jgi:glycosyltransferase involved in cell wall biosynthesis
MPLLGAAAGSLTIYGSGMTEEVRDLAGDRVIARGYVEDLAAAFQSHRIFVAPLLSGAGIKGKVLAALSHGIPVVLSPIAAEGIGLRSGHDCLIAEDPREWCTAIECLTRDDAMWQDMSAAAQRYMREAYSFDAGRAAMRRAFEAADLYRTRP